MEQLHVLEKLYIGQYKRFVLAYLVLHVQLKHLTPVLQLQEFYTLPNHIRENIEIFSCSCDANGLLISWQQTLFELISCIFHWLRNKISGKCFL